MCSARAAGQLHVRRVLWQMARLLGFQNALVEIALALGLLCMHPCHDIVRLFCVHDRFGARTCRYHVSHAAAAHHLTQQHYLQQAQRHVRSCTGILLIT